MRRRTEMLGLVGLFVANVLLRLPGLLQEQAPYRFCDEDFFVPPSYQMLMTHDWSIHSFISGGLNFYLPLLAGKLAAFVLGRDPSEEAFLLLVRLSTTGVLASAAVFFIYGAAKALSRSRGVAALSVVVFTLSPMLTGFNRVHYPDYYIAFFSSAVAYFAAHMLMRPLDFKRGSALLDAVCAGLFAGLAASVKYTGVILCALIALTLLVRLIKDYRNLSLVRALRCCLLQGGVACIAAIAAFVATNAEIFSHVDAFLADVQISHYHPSPEPGVGWLYYSGIIFLSAGVLGTTIYAAAIVEVWRKNRAALLFLAFCPFLLVLTLGRYQLLFHRNMLLGMPFVCVLGGFGLREVFAHLMKWQPRQYRWWIAAASCLLLAEPIAKVGYSLYHDFLEDSRKLTKAWLLEEAASGRIAPKDRILANIGCGYPAVVPASSAHSGCYDYLILDSWFGGLQSDGSIKKGDYSIRRIVSEMDVKALHFLDEDYAWSIGKVADVLVPSYRLVKVIEGYGPREFIFHRPDCHNERAVKGPKDF